MLQPRSAPPVLKPFALLSGTHALGCQRGSLVARALPQDADAHDALFGRREVARLTAGLFAGALAVSSRLPRARAEDSAPSLILPDAIECGGLKLSRPRPIGGGVQAQVFAVGLESSGTSRGSGTGAAAREVAVKVAKLEGDYATQTFQREKMILDKLQAAGVPGVVSCLAEGDVSTSVGSRKALVLDPFLPNARNFSVKAGRLTALPIGRHEEEFRIGEDVFRFLQT
eukprot:TRINITY_DN13061_c0_g1_i3.p1 TRINITY_DN13061_c0_g1~~TRINITY_DN13061_c0_g1_i3.p1  ORF type:complete len:241 (-),score=35.60 TRINITY_DN13061_c0_g1_i3:123-806(-)